MKVLVTGANGFLGRHLLPVLEERYGADNITGVVRGDYDLMDPVQVARLFRERRPEVIVHLAAYSGGIGVNRLKPADFYYRNTILTALMFQMAAEHGVKKMIYPMGGCSYPADARSPISEDQMWNGFPQPESAGYSAAKKMGLVASAAYRIQYGLNSVVLVPGNMYGEFDNFRAGESHVIPAMIRRFHEAKSAGVDRVVMWGTGAPVRDFVYAGDVAGVIPHFIENYDQSDPVNISSGSTTSIRELAETICALTGFKGNIVWDSSQPDGQMTKIFSVERLKKLGLSCSTPLRRGLEKTIRWFSLNYANGGDGIRL